MRHLLSALLWGSLLAIAQVMLLPRWSPIGFVPDLLLLAVVLKGFGRADSRTIWLGLVVGLAQGWLHGTAWWAFAISRTFAAWLSGWLRVRWLWLSAPASGFCAAVTTLAAEAMLALLLTVSERSGTPLALWLVIAPFEALVNAMLGTLVFWFCRPKEVLA